MTSASTSQPRSRPDKLVIAPPSNIPRLTASHPLLAKESVPRLLDEYRPLFANHLQLQAIALESRQLGSVLNNNKIVPHFFNAVGYRHVRPHPDGQAATSQRIIVLNVPRQQPFPAELDEEVTRLGLSRLSYDVELGYDHLSSDAVLEAMLPLDLVAAEGVPTGFTIVGHIAHLNLIDAYLPFRFLVGAVLLQKNATSIRTVVNKLDSIDTQFRFFKMELLAGDDDYTAHVSESDCTFTFDFRTVYWNSRLHGEHARLVSRFRPNQVVADVMAGVGPFAVPAAKKGVWVLANDLNPKSYEALCTNGKTNHVLESTEDNHLPRVASSSALEARVTPSRDNTNLDGGLLAFCRDGRTFIRDSALLAWSGNFRGRPTGFGMDAKGDEKLNEFARKTIKARAKAKRAEHARRHEQKVQGKATPSPAAPSTTTTTASTSAPPTLPSAPATATSDPSDLPRHHPRLLIDHFVMNLPASALEFLDAFRGLYTHLASHVGRDALDRELSRRESLRLRRSSADAGTTTPADEIDDSQEPLPWIHVHCFSKDPLRPGVDILNRANKALGLTGSEALCTPPILPPQTSTASRRSNRFVLPDAPSTTAATTEQTNADEGDLHFHSSPVQPLPTTQPDLDRIATFTSTEEMMAFLQDEFQRMGVVPTPNLEIHYVRDVAPNKQMYCLSFQCPREVLFAND